MQATKNDRRPTVFLGHISILLKSSKNLPGVHRSCVCLEDGTEVQYSSPEKQGYSSALKATSQNPSLRRHCSRESLSGQAQHSALYHPTAGFRPGPRPAGDISAVVCVQLWALVQPCKGKTRALTLGPRSGLLRDSPKDSTRAPQPSPREGTNPNKAGSTTKMLWRNQVHQVLPDASLRYHMPRARRGGKKKTSTQGAGSGFCRGHGAHRAALTFQESGEGGSRTGSVGPTRKP